MVYWALKPRLVIEKSVVNLILNNVVLSPLTVTVNPGSSATEPVADSLAKDVGQLDEVTAS